MFETHPLDDRGAVVLLICCMGVHPGGGVMVAVSGRTEMEAIMTSPATVPCGLRITLPNKSWLNSNQA